MNAAKAAFCVWCKTTTGVTPEGSCISCDQKKYKAALDRVRRYVEMRDQKPFSGLSDLIHGIHTGTEWEAELMLSDLRVIVEALK
jgi:hypothetical protein